MRKSQPETGFSNQNKSISGNYIRLPKEEKFTLTKISKRKRFLVIRTKMTLPKQEQEEEEEQKPQRWEIIASIGNVKIKQSLLTDKVALFFDDDFVTELTESEINKLARVVFVLLSQQNKRSRTFIYKGDKVVVRFVIKALQRTQ